MAQPGKGLLATAQSFPASRAGGAGGMQKEQQDVQMITGEREGCGVTSSGRQSRDWGRSFPFGK